MTWCEAFHQVHYLLGFPGSAGQVQLLLVFSPGPLSMCYKAICRWLLLVLGLKVPKRGQTANQGWLLLAPGLGPLNEMYKAC